MMKHLHIFLFPVQKHCRDNMIVLNAHRRQHIITTTAPNMKASEELDPLESHYEQESKEQMAIELLCW
jgi:hypothetical protein